LSLSAFSHKKQSRLPFRSKVDAVDGLGDGPKQIQLFGTWVNDIKNEGVTKVFLSRKWKRFIFKFYFGEIAYFIRPQIAILFSWVQHSLSTVPFDLIRTHWALSKASM
jgi:hypothetical protein